MIEKTFSLILKRKEQNYSASISYIQGNLNNLSNHLDLLHPEEHQVFQNFKFDRRKISYLLGRLSAKKAIQQLTNDTQSKNIWVDSGVFQFPVVRCKELQNIQVSISHCEDIGISIAFPEAHPMGIDVEKVNLDREEVILSQTTNQEKELLSNNYLNSIDGYTRLFTAKEALSKILKTGMMIDFKYLEVNNITMKDEEILFSFTHFGQYKAYTSTIQNYAFAIALPKRTSTNTSKIWTAVNSIVEY